MFAGCPGYSYPVYDWVYFTYKVIMISQYTTIKYLEVIVNKTFVIGGREGGGACGTFNYWNPVRKFAKFPFTEPIK